MSDYDVEVERNKELRTENDRMWKDICELRAENERLREEFNHIMTGMEICCCGDAVEDHASAFLGGHSSVSQLDYAIGLAVKGATLAERQRCAEIARNFCGHRDRENQDFLDMVTDSIAAAIMEGK